VQTTTTATTTSRATTTATKEYRLLSFMRLRDQVWIANWNVVQKMWSVHKSDLQILSRHLRVNGPLWLLKISKVFYIFLVCHTWLLVLSLSSIIQ
jgi:hypothetical protein